MQTRHNNKPDISTNPSPRQNSSAYETELYLSYFPPKLQILEHKIGDEFAKVTILSKLPVFRSVEFCQSDKFF